MRTKFAHLIKPDTPFTQDLTLRVGLLAVSAVFYLVACFAPALTFVERSYGGDYQTWTGFQILFYGWLGPLILQFGWFANPLLGLSMLALFMRRLLSALVLSGLSLFFAANTFLFYLQAFPTSEGNTPMLTLHHPHIGFFFWVGSMLVTGAGAWLLWSLQPKRVEAEIPTPP